ncbi:MAG: hypothetical protein O3A99_09865 [Proteobacteria bacterium]|nr:hypothetical protein [Pseudomonadota bacterium]
MIPLEIIYDDIHTKEFYINNKIIKCVYDFEYCKYIQNPDLRTIKDGYYTYIIHDTNQLKIAAVCPFENGSKHIQLVQGTAIAYIGGEFIKHGNEIIYNHYAGLFMDTNKYNEKYHRKEMDSMIQKTFKNCNGSILKFVDHELINDQKFIDDGIWKIEDIKQMYYTSEYKP